MVAVMHVNNETGAIQPIAEIARKLRTHGQATGKRIHFHCDEVQALGKIPINCTELDIDSASFSAHKIGGLRGIGALYSRNPLPVIFRGGGQENGIRPGTENLPGIWSMAEAVARALSKIEERSEHCRKLRQQLVEGVTAIGGAQLIPAEATNSLQFSPYILSVAFPPLPGEVLVRIMSDAGFAISTGSACSSKGQKERRILVNMGLTEESARSAVRISIGAGTTEDELQRFVLTLAKEVKKWNMPIRA